MGKFDDFTIKEKLKQLINDNEEVNFFQLLYMRVFDKDMRDFFIFNNLVYDWISVDLKSKEIHYLFKRSDRLEEIKEIYLEQKKLNNL